MKRWLVITILLTAFPHGLQRAAAASGHSPSSGAADRRVPGTPPRPAARPGGGAQDGVQLAAHALRRPRSESSYVRFPGVGIQIMKPAGFSEAENFHGFQQPSTASSVMLLRIPGPFSEITRGFTAAQLKTRGMALHDKKAVNIDGLPGVLVNLTQRAYEVQYEKWILAFGDESRTYLVTAAFPQSLRARLSGSLKAAVQSTRLLRTPLSDPRADVPFTLAASQKLKSTPGMGKMLAFTREGVFGAKRPEDPLFIAAPSLSKVPMADRSQFALQRLSQTATTKVSALTSHEPIHIDGLDGFESLAEAQHSDSGIAVVVYQVILFDSGSYFLMQGLIGANGRNEYLPEFKSMARSFKRRLRS